MYGSDLPNNSFEGQLFFLENNEEIKGLPSYTTSNEGQILRIVNGVPTWSAIPIAEETNF